MRDGKEMTDLRQAPFFHHKDPVEGQEKYTLKRCKAKEGD